MGRKQKIRDAAAGAGTEPAEPRQDIENAEMNADRPAPESAKDGAEDKLKHNRDELGVDDEHKTPTMQKGHRGSFP